MNRSAMEVRQDERSEMTCDMLFAFVLTGEVQDGLAQVLFSGIVNDPEDPGADA